MPKYSTTNAATPNIPAWIHVPILAHGTTGRVLARRYNRNDRKVVRIIRFTAVFLALITPRAARNGGCEPPIAASSFESAIMVWGVPPTMAPRTSPIRGDLVEGRERSPPG